MRIAVITLVLSLALGTAALGADGRRADDRGGVRVDFRLNWGDPLFDPLLDPTGLGAANDRPGYRVFIPRGLGGREYYGGASAPLYDRFGGGYSGYDPGVRSRYYHRGYAVTPYADGFTPGYGYGYPGYSYGQPAYSYPNQSAIVIDGNPLYARPDSLLPPQYRGGDSYSYDDHRVYDNSTTTNNYYAPQPVDGSGATRRGDAYRRSSSVSPKSSLQPQSPESRPNAALASVGSSFGQQFSGATRLETEAGVWQFKLDGGKLFAAKEAAALGADSSGPDAPVKFGLVADKVDAGFAPFALYQPGLGPAVIFRQGGSIAAAHRTSAGKWWVEKLPYSVDFSAPHSIGMVGGDAWVTFSSTDQVRYVLAFCQHKWSEIGSGTRQRKL